ncbi:hypothetical protein PENSUB_5211 [Penicillium subrubescens]|uniref:LysM domain-containing protein n=2 Tax=Penicillium subrubescens TaxID=1316194 RepID=A0A1Q5UAF2_9EURO|nr:hypothetical protein PENSUB_5211 [Penicillium subrubescens]
MSASCTQFDAENDSEAELAYLSSSIQSVAKTSGVDARFILAIVLQESNGCVRVGTTNNGVTNPGLMQSHAGTGSCGSQKDSACPESEILQMIKDGTEGTTSGDGLRQCLDANGGSGETAYYRAARCYNSGSIAPSGNLGQGGSTHCYVSDVANRLLGWSSGPSRCNEATVGSLTGSSSQGTSPVAGSVSIASSTFATSLSLPVSVPLIQQSTTPSLTAEASAIPTMVYPYALSSCLSYATVSTGDYCEKLETEYGISAVQLRDWNPGLDEACTNLWCGYSYCIKA